MKVAGVEIPNVAVAELALLLHEAGDRDLAHRIGIEIDINQRELNLGRGDLLRALSVLEDCTDALAQLRAALLAQLTRTPRNGDARVA